MVPMTGLWTEKLYILFDYHRTKKLCFIEFLKGLAYFTKMNQEKQIKKLFQLYDFYDENFIS